MDDVNFRNSRRSGFFETDDDTSSSSSTIVDTLDLAVRRPASDEYVHPLERLTGRWTFQSMPQHVNLAAYGKQFSGEWPSFRGTETECCGAGAVVNATTFAPAKEPANGETQDGGIPLFGADGKNCSSAPNHPNAFARQCVAYAVRVFSWDFYRAVCLFFLPIVTFRNRR